VFGRAGACDAFTFGVTRWKQDEDFGQQHKLILEPLRSHLQNAVALTLEVQLQKRKAQIHNPLIEHLPVAIFLVDQSMQLLDHNRKGEELLKTASMFTAQHGILNYHHIATQELLLAKLKNYSRNEDSQNEIDPDAISGQSQRKGLPTHNIYLLPVLDSYLLCFQIVVTVADENVADPKTASLLASLFGLTDAEAQVAVSLFNGFKPVEIAEARGASVATVRAQLKSIMAKAHCHSQLELVRRISQLIIPFR
jgi:DNA-binding CsgD family transcriptional regulator